jgi:hypothetical protein
LNFSHHLGENRGPVNCQGCGKNWIPAFAGMT